MMKALRYISNYCPAHRIGTTIVRYYPNPKHDIHLGKRSNQNFAQIPHRQWRTQLEHLCRRCGIRTVEQVFWIASPCREGMGDIKTHRSQANDTIQRRCQRCSQYPAKKPPQTRCRASGGAFGNPFARRAHVSGFLLRIPPSCQFLF